MHRDLIPRVGGKGKSLWGLSMYSNHRFTWLRPHKPVILFCPHPHFIKRVSEVLTWRISFRSVGSRICHFHRRTIHLHRGVPAMDHGTHHCYQSSKSDHHFRAEEYSFLSHRNKIWTERATSSRPTAATWSSRYCSIQQGHETQHHETKNHHSKREGVSVMK